jgi:alpha-amylase/alpha-mannosidase (GH57 family)
MSGYVCIHGHFYQPPRENPWLEQIERQDSAYPHHDWNARITAECYAPNTASRILDQERRIIDIVNNYSKISFNFGPTLLTWMEKEEPEIYRALLEADRLSMKRFHGHGSAIAQAYNHMIMPLASSRDKRTQIMWGMGDFVNRFGRDPEGMWLPETAVDLETLDIVASTGIDFVILAPHQARGIRKIGAKKWEDVNDGSIDPKRAYCCRLPSGKDITVFFYDGPVSHDISFGRLLENGSDFATRLLGSFTGESDHPQLVHIATDGENYGHHHRFADMALAYCLYHIETHTQSKLTVYGEYLENSKPEYEVDIVENSSWSCAHGIERWRSDCGCHTGVHPDWNQKWRAPLREAMNWLRDSLVPLYEREMDTYVSDPWLVRDGYIALLSDRSSANVESFLSRYCVKELTVGEKVKVLKCLEMQRHSMLMFTSCGWFFDELSGIETVHVIEYASRAVQLAEELTGVKIEDEYTALLKKAESNIPGQGDAKAIYERQIKPKILNLTHVGAHYALSSLFEDDPEHMNIGCYTVESKSYRLREAGLQRLAVGNARIRSSITWDEENVCFAVLHLGDHNLIGGVENCDRLETPLESQHEVSDIFTKGDIPGVIRFINSHFETGNYTLWHLFREKQREILTQILDDSLGEIESSFRQIVERHYSIMHVMSEKGIPLPQALATPMEFILNTDLHRLLHDDIPDADQLQHLVETFAKLSLQADTKLLNFTMSQKIDSMMKQLCRNPEDLLLLESIESIMSIIRPLQLDLDLWEVQNSYFSTGKQYYSSMKEKGEKGDERARRWVEHFHKLEEYLNVKIT